MDEVIQKCAAAVQEPASTEDAAAQHHVQRFLGALHALSRAVQLRYRDDGKLDYRDGRAEEVAERMAGGGRLTDKDHAAFLAEFYFNAALERLAGLLNSLNEGTRRVDPDRLSALKERLRPMLVEDGNRLRHRGVGLLTGPPGRLATGEGLASVLDEFAALVVEAARSGHGSH